MTRDNLLVLLESTGRKLEGCDGRHPLGKPGRRHHRHRGARRRRAAQGRRPGKSLRSCRCARRHPATGGILVAGAASPPHATRRLEAAKLMAMKLYAFPPTRSIRALWTLRELDVEFELVQVNPVKGEHRRPEFLGLNPAGKLPVLA